MHEAPEDQLTKSQVRQVDTLVRQETLYQWNCQTPCTTDHWKIDWEDIEIVQRVLGSAEGEEDERKDRKERVTCTMGLDKNDNFH